MNGIKKLVIIAFLVFGIGSNGIHAISDDMAANLALGGGLLTGVVSSIVVSGNEFVRAAVGGSMFCVASVIGGWFWGRLTPRGRLERAEAILMRARTDEFCNAAHVASCEVFMRFVMQNYLGSSWPLVLVHQHLCKVLEEFQMADSLCAHVLSESSVGLQEYMGAHNCRLHIKALRIPLEQGLMYIMQHCFTLYEQQLKLYQRDQLIRQNEQKIDLRQQQCIDRFFEYWTAERRHQENLASQQRAK